MKPFITRRAERPLMISATDLPAPLMRWEDFLTSTRKDLRSKSISLITLTIVLPAVLTVLDMTRQSISDFPMTQRKMTALKTTSGKKQPKKLIMQKIFLSTVRCFRATMTDLQIISKKSAEPHQAPTAVKSVRELQAAISTRQLCLITGLAMQTRIS